MEGLLQNSPKRGRNELQITNCGKRNLKEVLALPNEGTNAKYQKIGHDEGTIISAYYTQGHEEKYGNLNLYMLMWVTLARAKSL